MGREKVITSQPTSQITHCINCGKFQIHAKGRCRTCYRYHNEHGIDRVIKKKPAVWCKNCGHIPTKAHGRCACCHEYHAKYRKERPRYLWDKDAPCKTCGVPLSSQGTYNGRRRQVKGRCIACDMYKRKMGCERPRHLWGIGEHGWCDCGRPATALIDGDIAVCNIHKE